MTYEWAWADEPERYEWTKGSFIYIPPYVVHQHFASEKTHVRLISATSRLVRALGFDGLEQLEDAPATS